MSDIGGFLLFAEQLKLFQNRPSAERQDKRRDYGDDRHKHKQAEGPVITGLVKYLAVDDRRYDQYGRRQRQEENSNQHDNNRTCHGKSSFRISYWKFHSIILSQSGFTNYMQEHKLIARR